MKAKRGLSPVIATVFILMLTISAVALIAGVLVPFVKKSLDKSTECVNYKEVYSFDESFGYNCIQEDKKLYAVSIKTKFDRGLLESVDGFRIVLNTKDGVSKGIGVNNMTTASNDAGHLRLLGKPGFRLPGAGEVVTYVYNGINEDTFVSADIYPVLKTGTICGEKDSVNFVSCKNKIV